MEDQVPFKVYMFSQGTSKPEVRRFGVDKNVVTNYEYLNAKIQEVYPQLKDKQFTISWQDEEGDEVKISSDEEVMTMLTALREAMVKLIVHPKKTTCEPQVINVSLPCQSGVGPAGSTLPSIHADVRCDGCGVQVMGFRYKCITCEDFDLCAYCESRKVHPEHCVVRIPSPQMSLFVIKESIKKSRQFLKGMAINMHEEAKRQKAEKKAAGCTRAYGISNSHCPFKPMDKSATKERREERRDERQEKRQERREERHERREMRDSTRQPRRSIGWMDIFSNYMDQFANLAADHIRNAAGGDVTEPTGQQTAEGIRNQLGVDPVELERLIHDCMINDECLGARLNREQTKVADPPTAPQESTTAEPPAATETSANPQVPTTSKVSTTSQVPTTSQAPTTQQPLITPQGLMTPPASPTASKIEANAPNTETKSESVSASSAVSVNISRDGSPDKANDDWTMINKEKDMESDGGVGAAHGIPFEDLPEEFRRPFITHGQIYPPLNTATADTVEIPMKVDTPAPASAGMPFGQPLVPPPAATATSTGVDSSSAKTAGKPWQSTPASTATSAGAAAQAGNAWQSHMTYANTTATAPSATAPTGNPWQSAAGDWRHHRVPHIDAAIRQMISMGFTNEGGWLTQLLESKDGNIAAVLDLLTPVNPNKK